MSEDNKKAGEDTKSTATADAVPFERYESLQQKHYNTEAELQDLKRRVSAFEKLGDPDTIKGKLEDYQLRKDKEAVDSGDETTIQSRVDEYKSQLNSEWGSKLESLETALQQKDKALHELQVVDTAMNTLGALFNQDTHPFIKDIVRSNVDMKDGRLIVKDSEGNVRETKPGQPLSLEDFGNELASKYPSMAKPQTRAGTKQDGEVRFNGISTELDRFMKMSSEERASLPKDEFNKLSHEAVKLYG